MDPADTVDDHVRRLMARAQQGDNDASETLLRAVAPRIRQTVRRRHAGGRTGLVRPRPSSLAARHGDGMIDRASARRLDVSSCRQYLAPNDNLQFFAASE